MNAIVLVVAAFGLLVLFSGVELIFEPSDFGSAGVSFTDVDVSLSETSATQVESSCALTDISIPPGAEYL